MRLLLVYVNCPRVLDRVVGVQRDVWNVHIGECFVVCDCVRTIRGVVLNRLCEDNLEYLDTVAGSGEGHLDGPVPIFSTEIGNNGSVSRVLLSTRAAIAIE